MKIQNLLKSILGTAFIAVLMLAVSCDAANNPALVGRWIDVSGKSNENVFWEFLSDGTGVIGVVPFTWKTEKDRFYLSAFGITRPFSYKLQGSMLTFISDNGEITKYQKCDKKNCQAEVKTKPKPVDEIDSEQLQYWMENTEAE